MLYEQRIIDVILNTIKDNQVYLTQRENLPQLAIAFPIGTLTLLGIGIIGVFSFVGLCTFLVTRLLGWAFNTDYFD